MSVYCVVVVLAVLSVHSFCFPYTGTTDVVPLQSRTFNKDVVKDNGTWIVEFYAPWCGHCKNMAPTYESLATKLKGIVNVGAVNCDEEKDLPQKFSVRGFPTILVFPGGAKNKKPLTYEGQRTGKSIADFATKNMNSFINTIRTSDELEKFVEENKFDGRVVLFSAKKDSSPLFKALSVNFSKSKSKFAHFPSPNEEVKEKYGATSFPSLIVFPSGEETSVRYQGAMKATKLNEFLSGFFTIEEEHTEGEEEKVRVVEFSEGVVEIDEEEVFINQCGVKSGGLCLLAVIDEEDDKEEVDAQHAVLESVWKEVRPWRVVRVLVASASRINPSFSSSLRLPDSGYPSAVLLAPKKGRYSPYVGSFSVDGIVDYLRRAQQGAVRTSVYDPSELPSLLQSGQETMSSHDEL